MSNSETNQSEPIHYRKEKVELNLQQQEHAKVMTAQNFRVLEKIVSSAADKNLALHSWNYSPDGMIVALFYPATEQSMEQQRRDIQNESKR